MTDMLIKLYDLPVAQSLWRQVEQNGITIRRAMAYERGLVVGWVSLTFGAQWADECQMAFGQHPVGCHIAVISSRICGFCCSGCTFKGFIGPIGIQDDVRGQGVGSALLLTALAALWQQGYAYAIVGNVAQPTFFEKCAGAMVISTSTPGPYPNRLDSI